MDSAKSEKKVVEDSAAKGSVINKKKYAPDELKKEDQPGNYNFIRPNRPNTWKLATYGDGSHLIERANVKKRNTLFIFDRPETPRFYPRAGWPEGAGEAHRRLHAATRAEKITLGGNANMSDRQLLEAYKRAYTRPEIQSILGDLRTPYGDPIPGGINVTPAQAFETLLRYYNILL